MAKVKCKIFYINDKKPIGKLIEYGTNEHGTNWYVYKLTKHGKKVISEKYKIDNPKYLRVKS